MACALIPVAALAIIGSVIVNRQLSILTTQHLDAAAKSYGLAVFDRISGVDNQLSVLAQGYLDGAFTATEIAAFSDGRAAIRAEELPPSQGTSSVPGITRQLQVSDDVEPAITLDILAREGTRSLRISARFSEAYLWNTDSVLRDDALLCVFGSLGSSLHCSAEEVSLHTARESRQGEWTLFLNGVYGTQPWTIRLWAPQTGSAIATFRWLLPAVAVLAIAGAILAGSILIRRSHAPLRLLTDAAQRIGRERFNRPIRINSDDEYGRLARSFNRMARRLDDQFDLLGLLAQLDLTILARSGIESAIRELLPKLPPLLKCRIAAIHLSEGDLLFIAVRGSAQVQQLTVRAGSGFSSPMPHNQRLSTAGSDSPLAARFAEMGVDTLVAQSIEVGGVLRAQIIVSDEHASSAFVTQRLHDIAHRLAVAFGNEDHQNALVQQAYSDSLTGLPNRARLREWLAERILNGEASVEGAVVFLDLDRFKSVNDSLGHSLGDSLLLQIARRLQQQLPANGLLARFGGDEFVIVLPETDRAAAQALTQAMLDSLREPCVLEHIHYVAQASAGIAMYPADGTTVDELLKHADVALYGAKAGGRGRTCFFDSSMSHTATDRLLLEERLRAAIRDQEIVAHYQPKLDSRGELAGLEALARWTPRDGEPIPPARFIPLAEETGLIVPMGELLLRQTCTHIRRWRDAGLPAIRVAINISMLQLRDSTFVDLILRCLAEHDLNGEDLEIELTESVFAEDRQAIARQLAALADAGIRIAIDDFGTGFSSMSLLRDLPIHSLKIDRSFVVDATTSSESHMLLRGLIDIGHSLNLEVVAEGVETAEQFALLKDLHCDVFQGYLFAKALAPVELDSYLRSRHSPRAPALHAVGGL